jgi:acyl-coenzyme A synthetase/AMP-(fatty) acid ligase
MFIKELPRNKTGKVLKNTLAKAMLLKLEDSIKC